MSTHNILMSASGASQGPLYVDDVFSAYTRSGTSSTYSINNGIDLAGKGGLLWTMHRDTWAGVGHYLQDTARGAGKQLDTSSTAASATFNTGLQSFDSTGYTLNTADINTSGHTFVDWTFRKAPRFFDCGTYTGDGVDGRDISHELTVSPGLVLIKCTSASTYWVAKHKDALSLTLNTTNSQGGTANTTNGYVSLVSSTSFNVVAGLTDLAAVNASGASYVWYAFAHDPSADGIIQCGSYTGNGSLDGPSITTGWETQFVIIKNTSAAADWEMQDVMRGMSYAQSKPLFANLSVAEGTSPAPYVVVPTATGFKINNDSSRLNTSGQTYIYLAIRRPNKPPTSGTQVYNAIARTGTGAAATVTGVGFAPDLGFTKSRTAADQPHYFYDKLRGSGVYIRSDSSGSESTWANVSAFGNDGVTFGSGSGINGSGLTYINHFFRRAPGVFDVVCWTGTGANPQAVPHSLGVVPELVIVKRRDSTSNWPVYDATTGLNTWMNLCTTSASASSSGYWTQAHTATNIYCASNISLSSATFVAYLFATKAGISKVGSYTGNGSTQTINCGFTTGARFVLIKRTDSTGDWWVWDTARGITSSADPRLALNSTNAESTSASDIQPSTSGFEVESNIFGGNINASGATYIYLAFA